MRGYLRYLCLLLLMFTQACNVVEEMPAERQAKPLRHLSFHPLHDHR